MSEFQIVFEPLTAWPAKSTDDRRPAPFRSTYDQTLRLLRFELDQIDTTGAVAVQVVTGRGHADLRRDGMLAVRALVIHPGVRVSFTCRHGALTYGTDRYEEMYSGQPPSWQANLRAIALSLRDLRAVDRHGVSGSGEQYRGWQQLTARTGSSSGMSAEVAWKVIEEESGWPQAAVEQNVREAVRIAKRNAHPDSNDTDRTRWDALAQALDAVGIDS